MSRRGGIRHLEPALLQVVAIIQERAGDKARAFRIHHHVDVQRTHQDVSIGRTIDQIHLVLETGATAPDHREAQRAIRAALPREQRRQLF
jgi:hypothetical protein